MYLINLRSESGEETGHTLHPSNLAQQLQQQQQQLHIINAINSSAQQQHIWRHLPSYAQLRVPHAATLPLSRSLALPSRPVARLSFVWRQSVNLRFLFSSFLFFLYLILDFFASLCALAPSSICLVACHGTRTPHRLPGRAASILLCFACKYTCNLSFNAVSTHPPLPRPIRRPSSHILAIRVESEIPGRCI